MKASTVYALRGELGRDSERRKAKVNDKAKKEKRIYRESELMEWTGLGVELNARTRGYTLTVPKAPLAATSDELETRRAGRCAKRLRVGEVWNKGM